MYDLTMYDWDYSSYHKCLHKRGYLAVLTPIVHRQIVNNFIPTDFRPGRRRCRHHRRCRLNLPCPEGRSDGYREVLDKEEYDDVEGGIITGNFVRKLLARII